MFIEITEYLRCPAAHDPEWLVLMPEAIVDRRVTGGTIGCPVCHAAYPIVDGVVRFGAPSVPAAAADVPAPDVLQALIGLESPGGYVVLVGSAARAGAGLAPLLEGSHVVAVNPQEPPGGGLTVLEAARVIPIRDRVVRGVVLGGEVAEAMLDEAVRIVLRGQRVVILNEAVRLPDGLEELARGQGMVVGRKR